MRVVYDARGISFHFIFVTSNTSVMSVCVAWDFHQGVLCPGDDVHDGRTSLMRCCAWHSAVILHGGGETVACRKAGGHGGVCTNPRTLPPWEKTPLYRRTELPTAHYLLFAVLVLVLAKTYCLHYWCILTLQRHKHGKTLRSVSGGGITFWERVLF